MKEILMTRGFVALVDDEDFELVSSHRWYPGKYHAGYYPVSGGGGKPSIFMHRLIMNAPKGMCVDHINGDTLDNRRSNLRICTVADNNRNAKKPKTNTSGFKGVMRHYGKWRASISFNNKMIRIGVFDAPKMAHDAYKEKAKELFGEYARFE